tara:strand:+ start:39584 stop:40639 length:1056 start_codon:yes stop_codon:yes gene_type:complete
MRGGSKGVPNKNLREINGKPLMDYTINQALKSGLFEHVVISTDSEKIAKRAKELGAETWFLRPAELSTDEAPKLPVIRHVFLESEKYYRERFDVLIDLDVTSPLRKTDDINRAYQQFIIEDADILITGSKARKNPYFNMVEDSRGSWDLVKSSALNKILINENAIIKEAMNSISKSGEKCLIVVNPKEELLGTLSDGDIRKSILRGSLVDDTIKNIYNKNPLYLVEGNYDNSNIEKLFLEKKLDMIPIVNNKKVIDYIVWDKFFMNRNKLSKKIPKLQITSPVRRQDAPDVFDLNAAIYIWKRKSILKQNTLFTKKTSLHIMPEHRSVDIDSELDWKFVEFLMQNYKDNDD